jgi:cytochrome c biogenesis protein CcdA/thiol-disulfide isomerase/thioredoxin
MVLLLGIGFVAGVITAVSPCVLPVLPIVLAGGAAGGRRRPYAIVAGLVASFSLFTLTASAILSALGLPQDLLRNVAIALLFVIAATLLVPRLGLLIEAPLARLGRRPGGELGGGFVLGASLGLVFVPCAGPVLATVTLLAAQHRFGAWLVLLTLCYALGAGLVLLAVALGGQRVSRRLRATRRWWRPALGVVVAGAALAIVLDVDQTLQTRLGSYTSALQRHTEESAYAARRLKGLRGGPASPTAHPDPSAAASHLPRYAAAPDFAGIAHWLNTPHDEPLSMGSLRGKVVLVDFWTYSCINCLRTLPQLRAWYARYREDGFVIVGVHTPEFAFEHELGNVSSAVKRLHVTWPVALDNVYATWTAYSNEYWPADYLVDRTGEIRAVHFGEGDYGTMERDIRALLGAGGPTTRVADTMPTGLQTPETYLGPERLDRTRYVGSPLVTDRPNDFAAARVVPQNDISYGGEWTLSGQTAKPGRDAELRLHFHARQVYVVLTGRGRVTARLGSRRLPTLQVGVARLYTVYSSKQTTDAVLDLRFTAGVRAYSFTFG